MQTTLMALTAGPHGWIARSAESAKEAKESYDTFQEILQFMQTISWIDLLGRSLHQTFFIFGLMFAMTWLLIRDWSPSKARLHYGIALGSYLSSVVLGIIYEGFRTSNHVEPEQWATYMLYTVLIAMVLSVVSQHALLRNLVKKKA